MNNIIVNSYGVFYADQWNDLYNDTFDLYSGDAGDGFYSCLDMRSKDIDLTDQVDKKVLRRRIEDALRKIASVDDLVRIGSLLGVKILDK